MEWKVYFPRSLDKTLILAMKLSTILILFFCLQLRATGFAQGITLSEKEAKLETIFTKIFQQTGYEFFYNSSILEKAKPVSIDVKAQPLQEVLAQCFKDQPLDYELHDKTVVVKEKRTDGSSLISISGIITSMEDEPLESVTVREKYSGKGTVTNAKGEFILKDIREDAVLMISSVGFDQTEVSVNNRPRVIVRLMVSVRGLNETIVKGYYTTSRQFNTGSVGKITETDISTQPVSNVLSAMQGRIAGLSITQQTGVPNGSYSIQIRGRNSIKNGNEPLYIVDNVPYTSGSLNTYIFTANITGGGNPLNYLNPADIESVEVLKDADATAIYGSRGANGVILITTKKAKPGGLKTTFRLQQGFASLAKPMKLLNSKQYLQMRNEAFVNDQALPQPTDYDLLTWDTTRNTDWQKKLIGKNASVTDMHLVLSGGNAETKIMGGVSFRRETTVFPGNFSDKKASLHLNIDHRSKNSKLSLAYYLNYQQDNNNLLNFDLTNYALSLPPVAPEIYDSNGQLNWQNGTFDNPYRYLLQKYKSQADNFISNLTGSYKILPGLLFRLSAGYTATFINDHFTFPAKSYNPLYGVTSGTASFSNNSLKTWIVEPGLSYDRKFGKLQMNITVGGTLQENKRNLQEIMASGYTSDALLESLAAASSYFTLNAGTTVYRYEAVYGRIGFIHNERYIVNLTGRRDGSSRFGPDNKFANFGAIGGGWLFTKEPWLQNINAVLNYGKIRASYGLTGNDQITDYQYLETYAPTFYPYNNQSGLLPVRLANPGYGWETNKKLEAALELGFFKNRIFFEASYYRNRSGNQLVGYPLAPTTGFSSIQANLPAVIENHGIEIALNGDIIKGSGLTWSASANLTIPRDKLVAYPGIERSSYADVYVVGQSMSILRVYDYNSVDPATGIYLFSDKKGKGVLTPDYPGELINVAVRQDWYGGLENLLRYKSWSFSFFFQVVKQNGRNFMYNKNAAPGMMKNQTVYVMDRWQKPGDNTSIERFTQDYGSVAYSQYSTAINLSDRIIGDASFVRLKNLSLNYTLPQTVTRRLKISSLNLFVHCQNLFTITRYKGLDPENNAFPGALPPLRVINGGIELTF
jgi:TonB-linked SusC/RagA family outer membrane protein